MLSILNLIHYSKDAREIAAEAILLQEDKDALTQQKMAYLLAENVFGRVSRVVSPPPKIGGFTSRLFKILESDIFARLFLHLCKFDLSLNL